MVLFSSNVGLSKNVFIRKHFVKAIAVISIWCIAFSNYVYKSEPKDLTKDLFFDFPKNPPLDVPEKLTFDLPEDLPLDLDNGLSKDLPKGLPNHLPMDTPKDTPKNDSSNDHGTPKDSLDVVKSAPKSQSADPHSLHTQKFPEVITCETFLSDDSIEIWRGTEKVICQSGNNALAPDDMSDSITIKEYLNNHVEYDPVVLTFDNVLVKVKERVPEVYSTCPSNTVYHNDGKMSKIVSKALANIDVKDIVTTNKMVFTASRFDTNNIYEGHHIYINTYASLKMLGLLERTQDIFFIATDDKPISPNFDHYIWKLIFSNQPPIYGRRKEIGKDNLPVDPERSLFENESNVSSPSDSFMKIEKLIRGSAEYTSLLVTKSKEPGRKLLSGRGSDHHCPSSFLKEFADFIKARHLKYNTVGYNGVQVANNDSKKKQIKIIWSSRKTFFNYHNMENQTPSRDIVDEDEVVRFLRQELLSDKYKAFEIIIDVLNFGNVSFEQILGQVQETDILIGAHGAGLTHAIYMKSTGAIIEIFGGNRGRGNRHYHNIASLMGLSHYELSTSSAERGAIQCPEKCRQTVLSHLEAYLGQL